MLPKTNLYVIDDDAAVCDSIVAYLDSAGFPVRPFASTQDFLDEACNLTPGCLICDIGMLQPDGIALLKRIAELGMNFPAVMMTGDGDADLAVQAMKAGAIDFIEKPFSQEAILEGIERAEEALAQSQKNWAAAEQSWLRAKPRIRRHRTLSRPPNPMS